MKLRLPLLALLSLGLVIACSSGSDDKKIVYIVPDSGALGPDDSGLFCEPTADTPEATFNPAPVNQKVCSNADLVEILENCAFESASPQGCEAARTKLAACAQCIIGVESDPTSHPGYQYHPELRLIPSVSACMLAVAKTDEEKACAQAYGQIETCSLQACLTPCIDDEDPKHLSGCLDFALTSVCTKGTDVFVTDACQQHYTDATYGFCVSNKSQTGAELSDDQYFYEIAQIICGGADEPPSGDAGADGSTDSGLEDAGSDGG